MSIDGRDLSRIRTLIRDAELALLGLVTEAQEYGKAASDVVNEALANAAGYLALAGTELTDALKATALGAMGAPAPAPAPAQDPAAPTHQPEPGTSA